MRIAVCGLWHLGSVTAACLAAVGHDVCGFDFEPSVTSGLSMGRPPVHEPGLDELVASGLATRRLRFSSDPVDAVTDADVVWITDDTPVDDDDRADVEWVIDRLRRLLPRLEPDTLVLVSSQLPVGTVARIAREWRERSPLTTLTFGCVPENLRLGSAIRSFTRAERIVVGLDDPGQKARVAQLLQPFGDRIEWMSVASAEMTKHALNAFLATSVAYINEVATLCEHVGADAAEVARGLMSDARIGPGAYLTPGAAFAGGTLARDVVFMASLGSSLGVPTHLLASVKTSNDRHRCWAQRRLQVALGPLAGQTVGVWGLTYKAGTDTLRRSASIDLCRWLVGHGATVRVHDPVVKSLPDDLQASVHRFDSPAAAARGTSALVIATPWPEYQHVLADDVIPFMKRPLILDAIRWTRETLGHDTQAEYVSVGQATA
ncbi:MAG: UDP-glucose/GDP-mannose dehydrogenase family protein [Vicinamibacterales bacterium]